MAVTLYRCSKCRGLFNTVFEPLKMCRDCKLQQTSGGTSRASLRTSDGVAENEDLRIVEPEGDSMGGGKASAAIGGPIGDAQSDLSNAINDVTYQAFMARGQQNFSGGSQIRSTFLYAVPDDPEYKFTPEPESSPHDAILKPSRKLKFAAE